MMDLMDGIALAVMLIAVFFRAAVLVVCHLKKRQRRKLNGTAN